jgi:hypothetical protein
MVFCHLLFVKSQGTKNVELSSQRKLSVIPLYNYTIG